MARVSSRPAGRPHYAACGGKTAGAGECEAAGRRRRAIGCGGPDGCGGPGGCGGSGGCEETRGSGLGPARVLRHAWGGWLLASLGRMASCTRIPCSVRTPQCLVAGSEQR